MKEKFSIGELSDLSGVSRRTVHFYVQMKLLPPPHGAGRGFYYSSEHVECLKKIRELQEKGLALEEIRDRLSGTGELRESAPPAYSEEPPSTLWTRVPVLPGLEIHLQGGLFRLSPKRIEEFRKKIRDLAGQMLEPKP